MPEPESSNGSKVPSSLESAISKRSTKHSYIRFKNCTERKVDVIWINYEGVRVKYKMLQPQEFFDVTSFVSHPWIFRDADNHTKLICSSREVFDCPEPVYVKAREGGVKPTRQVVNITLPLYTLQDSAMQMIQKLIRKPEDISALEIPVSLQRQLHDRMWGFAG